MTASITAEEGISLLQDFGIELYYVTTSRYFMGVLYGLARQESWAAENGLEQVKHLAVQYDLVTTSLQ